MKFSRCSGFGLAEFGDGCSVGGTTYFLYTGLGVGAVSGRYFGTMALGLGAMYYTLSFFGEENDVNGFLVAVVPLFSGFNLLALLCSANFYFCNASKFC